MENILQLDTVDKYNKLYGLETLHPLVSVIDLTQATKTVNHLRMSYGLYAIYLKGGKECDIKYGRRSYDYQKGTIVCFAPGQTVEVSKATEEVRPKVYGLLFHPDILHDTPLGKEMKNFGFFSYSVNEALHLSERERKTVTDCLATIQMELEHAIDKHSRQLIAMNIGLLLAYCKRFYERQFITRSEPHKDILEKFEHLVNDYFTEGEAKKKGLPTVKYFADKICLSPNYFGDLVKKETGQSPLEYIQSKLLNFVKEKILGTELTISEIAYELGFKYPQHLSRFFKNVTGITPNEYRTQESQSR